MKDFGPHVRGPLATMMMTIAPAGGRDRIVVMMIAKAVTRDKEAGLATRKVIRAPRGVSPPVGHRDAMMMTMTTAGVLKHVVLTTMMRRR